VLELGGSVLVDDRSLQTEVADVARHLDAGQRVVAVVWRTVRRPAGAPTS